MWRCLAALYQSNTHTLLYREAYIVHMIVPHSFTIFQKPNIIISFFFKEISGLFKFKLCRNPTYQIGEMNSRIRIKWAAAGFWWSIHHEDDIWWIRRGLISDFRTCSEVCCRLIHKWSLISGLISSWEEKRESCTSHKDTKSSFVWTEDL